VIASHAIRSLSRRRMFLALLLVAWGPFVVRAFQIYFATSFEQLAVLAPTAETFREFLDQQGMFVFFVTIYVGAGLIANDRRANALQIYLSKPLSRVEYVAGKFATLAAFLLLVTWVPGLLLLFVQILLAGSFAFAQKNIFLFPAITVFALLQVFVASFTMLALSSLSKSGRFVGIMYAGAMIFTNAMFSVIRNITGRTTLAWLSPDDTLDLIGDVIFRLRPRYELSPLAAIVSLAFVIALSLFILERRVRGVEVVT
jgi:ABC-2 type transport system permease protein